MSALESAERRNEISPFVIPTEEDVFQSLIEAKSRTKRSQSGIDNQLKKIHEKTTSASRMQASFTSIKDLSLTNQGPDSKTKRRKDETSPLLPRRRAETVAEFIGRKREIFLVQMNLDTKRAEICKLEQRTLQREEALKRSEEMLEEDAIRFDAFLKENDEKVQHALKIAELETKKKQGKIAEIKKLEGEIATLRSELNKYEEQLEDFQQCKQFLDSVTPVEWFEEQTRKYQANKEEEIKQWRRQCEIVKKRKAEAVAAKTQAEVACSEARTKQEAALTKKKLKEAVETLKAIKLLKEPPKPTLDDDCETALESEPYFKQPDQLLDLFNSIEEQNVFLISHLQEVEEDLDRYRSRLTLKQTKIDGEIESLAQQVSDLESLLQKRTKQPTTSRRCFDIQKALFHVNESTTRVTEKDVHKQLCDAYQLCGFTYNSDTGSLSMLKHIEMKLDELLLGSKKLSREYIESSERLREKKRRQRQRAEKQEQQKKEHDLRVQRALERAAAPVFKRKGKPNMFRSLLRKKKVVVEENETHDEDHELADFLATEF